MAKFLRTKSISGSITDIIAEAEHTIGIITPYPNIHDNFLRRLEEADKRGVEINFVYGKKKNIPQDQFNNLKSYQNIEMRFHKDLHAKCYYNEKKMVIASMNLHQYSEENNREMGVLITLEKDADVYSDAMKEIESITCSADIIKERIEIVPQTEPDTLESPQKGHCIRCAKAIDYDFYHPYCLDCYKSWKKYKNRNYEEKYCHSCRQDWKTAMNHPLCTLCFNENKKT